MQSHEVQSVHKKKEQQMSIFVTYYCWKQKNFVSTLKKRGGDSSDKQNTGEKAGEGLVCIDEITILLNRK